MEIEFGSSCFLKTLRRGEVIKYSLRFFASPTDRVFFGQVSLLIHVIRIEKFYLSCENYLEHVCKV